MEPGLHVHKYQVAATFRERVVAWTFAVQTDDGERYELAVRDGDEIPILLDIVRHDGEVFFDPRTGTLSTGWNDPGR